MVKPNEGIALILLIYTLVFVTVFWLLLYLRRRYFIVTKTSSKSSYTDASSSMSQSSEASSSTNIGVAGVHGGGGGRHPNGPVTDFGLGPDGNIDPIIIDGGNGIYVNTRHIGLPGGPVHMVPGSVTPGGHVNLPRIG